MGEKYKNVEEYIDSIDEKWMKLFKLIYETVSENIPKGFEETINYEMIGYVVPHKLYPKGYHVKPEEPLPFINIAVQKQYISIYHLGLYNNPELLNWFIKSHKEEVGKKPNMGKSCIRYKKEEEFPKETMKELVRKIDVETYIEQYEKSINRN